MKEKNVTMEEYTTNFLEEIYKAIGRGWKIWVLSKPENKMLNEIILYNCIWLENYFTTTSYPYYNSEKIIDIIMDSFINYNKRKGATEEMINYHLSNISTTFHFISDYFNKKYNGKVVDTYDEMGMCLFMSTMCQVKMCIPKIENNKILHSMISEYYAGIIKYIIEKYSKYMKKYYVQPTDDLLEDTEYEEEDDL